MTIISKTAKALPILLAAAATAMVGAPAAQAHPANDHVAADHDWQPSAQQLRTWGWLLGRWKIDRYGGSVDFVLERDGTVSATISGSNNYMRREGYTAGMTIIRGLQFKGSNGVTWVAWTKGGRHLSAHKPGRKPGQTYGQASWINTGVVFLQKGKNHINVPAQLSGRLGNYAKWYKDTSIPNSALYRPAAAR